jgi:hypothetical protein
MIEEQVSKAEKHSQSELLKSLCAEQRRVGIQLLISESDLHTTRVNSIFPGGSEHIR